MRRGHDRANEHDLVHPSVCQYFPQILLPPGNLTLHICCVCVFDRLLLSSLQLWLHSFQGVHFFPPKLAPGHLVTPQLPILTLIFILTDWNC